MWPLLASAAIPLSPPQVVTPREVAVAAGRQDDAQVATSGRETLVAWHDVTPGRDGMYVAELAPDGTLVPGTQRRIAPGAIQIALTWTGHSYLALWSTYTPYGLHAMTLGSDGQPSSAARFILPDGNIRSNVVWAGSRGAVMSGRSLVILDREGNLVSFVRDVGTEDTRVMNIRLATDGQSFTVFMEEDRVRETALTVRRYATSGVALDAAPVEIARFDSIAAEWDVAFGDGRFALALTSPAVDSHTLHRYLLTSTTLQAVRLADIAIGVASGAHVEWTGDRFVALWLHRDLGPNDGSRPDTYTLRMLPFTERGDSEVVITPAHTGRAAKMEEAWTGTALVVAYTRLREARSGLDIYAQTASPATGASTLTAVALSPQWQSLPAAATNGRNTLVAWTEGHPGELMRVAITRTTGGVTDRPVVYLSERANATTPAVLWTGSSYLVMWVEGATGAGSPAVMVERVSADGTPLGAAPAGIRGNVAIAAAWNGAHALVVASAEPGLFGVRLTAEGRAVDSTSIELTTAFTSAPSVASNGTDFLVVWSQVDTPPEPPTMPPPPTSSDVKAARVSAAGIVESKLDVAIGPAHQENATVASDGRDYLIVYNEYVPYENALNIVSKKVLREAVLAGTTAAAPGRLIAATGLLPNGPPAVTPLPNGYLVAWEESDAFQEVGELFLAGVDRDGAVTDPAERIDGSLAAGMLPALVSSGARAQLFYSVLMDDAYGPTMRLVTRTAGNAPPKGRAVRR